MECPGCPICILRSTTQAPPPTTSKPLCLGLPCAPLPDDLCVASEPTTIIVSFLAVKSCSHQKAIKIVVHDANNSCRLVEISVNICMLSCDWSKLCTTQWCRTDAGISLAKFVTKYSAIFCPLRLGMASCNQVTKLSNHMIKSLPMQTS